MNAKIEELKEQIKQYEIEENKLFEKRIRCLEEIIKECEQLGLLKEIESIPEIQSAKFELWNDMESGAVNIELILSTKKKRKDFNDFEEWFKYREEVFEKVCDYLSEQEQLNLLILPTFE